MKRENIYIKLAKHRKKLEYITFGVLTYPQSTATKKKVQGIEDETKIVNSIKTCEKISKSYKATNLKVIQKCVSKLWIITKYYMKY